MTIDNFSNIVHFLREKPHYFLLPYCIVVIKDHFFKVKIGMIDMGGLLEFLYIGGMIIAHVVAMQAYKAALISKIYMV